MSEPFKKRGPLVTPPVVQEKPKKPPQTWRIRAVVMPGTMITKRLIKPVGMAVLLLASLAHATSSQVSGPQGNQPATFPFGGSGGTSGVVSCGGGNYTKTGTFPVLNAVAPSGSTMTCNSACEAAFLWVITGTATGNLQRSIDAGAHWIDVAVSTISATGDQTITFPNGLYRPTLTVCTGCTATVSWSCVP